MTNMKRIFHNLCMLAEWNEAQVTAKIIEIIGILV